MGLRCLPSAGQASAMGHPAEKLDPPPRRATLADLKAVPRHKIGEIIRGTLYIFSRPAPKHAAAASTIGFELGGPYHRGRGGPGGWWILDEPELHFPDPEIADEVEAVVPDLAGWRVERMPELPDTAYFALAPDWICEVISPSTEAHDRARKMSIYAREGVRHAWLIDPLLRTLEVFELDAGRWFMLGVYENDAKVKAEPFDAIELELAVLWSKPAAPGA
jgi:Uma2 family endonuclease